jgi:hypothetical protein
MKIGWRDLCLTNNWRDFHEDKEKFYVKKILASLFLAIVLVFGSTSAMALESIFGGLTSIFSSDNEVTYSVGETAMSDNVSATLINVMESKGNSYSKGDVLFQKTYNQDPLTKKRAKNKGELPMYYLEGSHPGIIDRETWECVRLELERQKAYCRDHHITVYHHHNEKNSLTTRITCSVCGSTFMLLRSKLVGDSGRAYWRCSSFRGKRGLSIEGRTFSPQPMRRRRWGCTCGA